MHRLSLRSLSLLALLGLAPIGFGCDVKQTSLQKGDGGGAQQGQKDDDGDDGADDGVIVEPDYDDGGEEVDGGNVEVGDEVDGGEEVDGGNVEVGDEGGSPCDVQLEVCLAEDNTPALCEKLFAACQGEGYEGGDVGETGFPGEEGGEAEGGTFPPPAEEGGEEEGGETEVGEDGGEWGDGGGDGNGDGGEFGSEGYNGEGGFDPTLCQVFLDECLASGLPDEQCKIEFEICIGSVEPF